MKVDASILAVNQPRARQYSRNELLDIRKKMKPEQLDAKTIDASLRQIDLIRKTELLHKS